MERQTRRKKGEGRSRQGGCERQRKGKKERQTRRKKEGDVKGRQGESRVKRETVMMEEKERGRRTRIKKE